MLKIGVYTVSQPGGVWKLVAPRSEMAPGGVPRSSGTMKVRAASENQQTQILMTVQAVLG